MKALLLLVLLSSVAQFCSAAAPLEPVTCGEDGGAAASRLATHHINEHHDHGYKFKLDKVNNNNIEKVDDGCNIEMQLDLLQTKCHTVNPKHFEDCDTHDEQFKAVMANCNVTMTVKDSDAEVTKYNCDTRKVHTDREMVMMCPDCPSLISLSSPEGLKAIQEGVKKFNENSTNQHIYVLQEVGSILSTWIPTTRMNYYPEFVLVETRCPWGSRIIPAACVPLCPDRAIVKVIIDCDMKRITVCDFKHNHNVTYTEMTQHVLGSGVTHELRSIVAGDDVLCSRLISAPELQMKHHAFCSVAYSSTGGLRSLECEVYPPTNTTALGPGEQEPVCRPPRHVGPPPHAGGHGPPPHAGGQGPPPHAGGQGPPPHAHGHGHGPPPHAGGQGPPPHAGGQGPPPHAHGHGESCSGVLTDIDPALHPICPWPLPDPRPNPRPSAD